MEQKELKEKFLKAIKQQDKIGYSTCSEGCDCKGECVLRLEAANQCNKILIEEKIELLNDLIFQTGDDINMWDEEKESYPIERIIKAMSNQCAELTNELKKL